MICGSAKTGDEQMSEKAPERIYAHPTSSEYSVNPWPLEAEEYTEYVRADLLAAVRREEREAAFKVLCLECLEGDEPVYDEQARWFYHRFGSDDVVGCSASKLRSAALERAATNDKEKDHEAIESKS